MVVCPWSPKVNATGHRVIFFIFQLLDGVVFFFILYNFIFTMVGILHFRGVQFYTFWICTIFWNIQLQLENFLHHQIFYTTLWLRKFSTRLKFLYYFSDKKFYSAPNYSYLLLFPLRKSWKHFYNIFLSPIHFVVFGAHRLDIPLVPMNLQVGTQKQIERAFGQDPWPWWL